MIGLDGERGDKGEPGLPGLPGIDGKPGEDGRPGFPGKRKLTPAEYEKITYIEIYKHGYKIITRTLLNFNFMF